jgi:CheY-like chemotaxis protein
MSADPVLTERRGVAHLRRRRRLLLVDEDAWSRGLADGVLRSRGYRVFCTGDARTAVSIARELLPDLVLADVGLAMVELVPMQQRRRADGPKLEPPPRPTNGYVVLRPLAADAPLASSPVVLVSDPGDPGRHETLRFDVPEHVPKPFTPQLLLQKVDRCLPRSGDAGRAGPAPALIAEDGSRGEVAMEGAIAFIGVAAILDVFHSNQLTGVCTLDSADGPTGEVGFEDGEIISASTSDGYEGSAAVFRVLAWQRGRFSFGLRRPERGALLHARFEKLILEGIRRLDETQARSRPI